MGLYPLTECYSGVTFFCMPTTKTRINLTVPAKMERQLHSLAKREGRSVSTTALDLIQRALETEEDTVLLDITKKREHAHPQTVSHARAWK